LSRPLVGVGREYASFVGFEKDPRRQRRELIWLDDLVWFNG
jgi:hypothetical protein